MHAVNPRRGHTSFTDIKKINPSQLAVGHFETVCH